MNIPPSPSLPLSLSSSRPLSLFAGSYATHVIWAQTKKTFIPEQLNKGQDWNRLSQGGDPEEECDAQDGADFEDMSIRDLNDDKIEVFS